jgi:phosphoribosylglycinamide formyltransferase-1
MISGRGSNMIALADAVEQGLIPGAEIALVMSDQPGAPGLARANERGVKAVVIERSDLTREQHEQAILAALSENQIDLVCLAGYMRLLSRHFIEVYRGRILNIHPSLLPAFPGLAAQRQALDHGAKWSGCTVHFVDETLDGGPIIAQSIVPVWEEDSEETLSERILEQEHLLYPKAVAQIVRGEYEIVGRRVLGN